MKSLKKSESIIQIVVISLLSFFTVTGIVLATTTIGTNVTTGGTLTVSGTATFSGYVTIPTGYALDSASGALSIGTTTASAITIGKATSTTTFPGGVVISGTAALGSYVTLASGYALDSVSGTLSIGTTTASGITIGKAGITTTVSGALTVSQTGTFSALATFANASSTLASFGGGTTVSKLLHGSCTVDFGTALTAGLATTTNCTATGVDTSSGYKIFMTSTGLEPYVAFAGASTTATDVIQVQIFNTSTSTDLTIGSHTWYWMAIK